MRVVFDTNVLIAAFVTDGVCAKLLSRARKNQFRLFVCRFVMDEFEGVLARKIKVAKNERRAAAELVLEAAELIPNAEPLNTGVCRDPDDDNVLASAVAAKAEYLVTGDYDLLVLKRHKGVKIIRPRDFELLFDD